MNAAHLVIFFLGSAGPAATVTSIDPLLVAYARTGDSGFTDIRTAIDATVEVAGATLDFGSKLAPGVSITSVLATSCAQYEFSPGTDSGASGRIVGTPTIVPSPSTGQPNQAVIIPIGTMVGGCIYLLQASVQCSDGSKPNGSTHITCRTVA